MDFSLKPDAIIEVRFKTTAEGGRKTPIVLSECRFGCPVFIDGNAFDCVFLLKNTTLELGGTYEVPVKFLSPELVLPMLSVGKLVTLWDGKEMASGKVVRL